MKQVFISYSRSDKAVANQLREALEAQGYSCWMDTRSLDAGVKWAGAIVEAIENASVLLLVYSKDASESEYVLREIAIALTEGVEIIPFCIDDTAVKGSIRFYLATYQRYDASTPPIEDHIKGIVQQVGTLVSESGDSLGVETSPTRSHPKSATATDTSHDIAEDTVESLKAVTVVGKTSMGNRSVEDRNSRAVWEEIHERWHGKEMSAFLAILGRADDWKDQWLCIRMLGYNAATKLNVDEQSAILAAIAPFLSTGGYVQQSALSTLRALSLPDDVVAPVVISAMQLAPDHDSGALAPILASLRTNLSGAELSQLLLQRWLRITNVNTALAPAMFRKALLELDERSIAPELCKLIGGSSHYHSIYAAEILSIWDIKEAVPSLRQFIENKIDTSDLNSSYLTYLYKLEGENAIEFLARLYPDAHPRQQKAIISLVRNNYKNLSSALKEKLPAELKEKGCIPGYFRPLKGNVEYEDGSEQTFIGFRCHYSGKLHFARTIEALSDSNYKHASSLEMKSIRRIQFGASPNENIRQGTAELVDGKKLEAMFFYVGECKWYEDPGIQGCLNEAGTSAVSIEQ